GQEQLDDPLLRGDLPADPEHGGGDVANRRPGTAGVGGDNHNPYIQPALGAAPYQFAQQRDHHDGGRQVIQHGGEKEGQQADDPQQRNTPARGDAISDDLEAAMGIDKLDDGHRAQQEEQDLGDFAQVMTQRTDHDSRGVGRVIAAQSQGWQDIVGTQHQDRPGHGRGEERGSRFVEFEGVFQRDT